MNVGESLSVNLANDVPSSKTTLISAGLPFPVGAGESYHFIYTLSCTATNLAGFDHKINAPNCNGNYINTSSTSASMGSGLAVNSREGKVGTFQDTTSNTISGDFVNTGGATTCDLMFAQNTTNAIPSKVKKGSSVLYTRTA